MRYSRIVALCMLLWVPGVHAQGTIFFTNRYLSMGIDAPVLFQGYSTNGEPLDEVPFVAQLFVEHGGSWEAVGEAVPFHTHPDLRGYVNGGNVVVPFVAPGASATVLMRVWSANGGPDWDAAVFMADVVLGESAPISITLGGAGSPPSLPANLVGLQSLFAWCLSCGPKPDMGLVANGDGTLTLSWDTEGYGGWFILESTTDLVNPVWTPVEGVSGDSVTINLDQAAAYYRLSGSYTDWQP